MSESFATDVPDKHGATGSKRKRVIPADSVESLQRWQLPNVDGGIGGGPPQGMLTAAGMEKIQKQAHDEGFSQGHQAGLAAAQQELQRLMSHLEPAIDEIDQNIVHELTELAVAIARQLVRRELHLEPGEIIPIVQEAVAQLPTVSQGVMIHLHPEDAAILRSATATSAEDGQRLSIIEDASLSRGDCRVTTDSSSIDASLETRLNAVVTRMLGGEREEDGPGNAT